MISEILKRWIAQSESWQTFIDFKLSKDSIAKYDFFERPDDFYISLFGEMYEVLENPEGEEEKILSIAKGLEIYSLKNKRDSFSGVNYANNILFASGLYYLADYSPSAFILASISSFDKYQTDIEIFLLSFLSRKQLKENKYRYLFDIYLKTGNIYFYDKLVEQVKTGKDYYYKYDPIQFSIYYLAETILNKFRNNNIWIDLLKHNNANHWKRYIAESINKNFPIWDFFPSQRLALNKGILGKYKSMALQTPTSSGKTAICELLIYNELKNNPSHKILYLAPFRALACELKQSFGKNLSNLNISSKTIYGGDIPSVAEKKAIQDVSLLIATPEKFMAIENIQPDFSENFTMVICDEGHLLDDNGSRGLSYELLLSRLKKDESKKFVFISAIIPNIEKINSWLGGEKEHIVKSNYRATEIEYAFLKPQDSSQERFLLEVNPLSKFPKKYILYNFITKADLVYKIQLKTKEKFEIDNTQKSKSAIIALKAIQSGSVALFAPTKGGNSGVRGLANEVKKQIQTKPNLFNNIELQEKNHDKTILKEYFKMIFGEKYLLTQIVDYGFLFHNGDLPQNVREIIEEYIEQKKIKLIISTKTLAEGVNLPIKTIVIHSISWFSPERKKQEKISLRDLKNLFGRAGRAGRETKGLIIVPNPNDYKDIENVINENNIEIVQGRLFRIIKNISDKKLILTAEKLKNLGDKDKLIIDTIDTAIIDLLGENIDIERLEDEVQNLIGETFASYQANKQEKKVLNTLISLRGEKIKPFIKSGEFSIIKKSSSTLRVYEEIKDKVDIENPIWVNVDSASSDEWLDFILNIVSELSIIKYQFNNFNKINLKKKNDYLTLDDVKRAIKLWIKGAWFEDISSVCLDDVDISLRVVHSLIGYNLQNAISSVVHIVDLKLKEEKKEISQIILDFPQYLIYGLQNRLQLDLIEIGFTDRAGIIELSNILNGRADYTELRELKNILRNNSSRLVEELTKKIPIISLDKTKNAFDYLEYYQLS